MQIVWILTITIFEAAYLYNRRSPFPKDELQFLSEIYLNQIQTMKPVLNLVNFDGDFTNSYGFLIREHQSNFGGDPTIIDLRNKCCEGDATSCIKQLNSLSQRKSDELEYWLILDRECKDLGLIVSDQVAFAPSVPTQLLDQWSGTFLKDSTGPFVDSRPAAIVRLLLVDALEEASYKRIDWSPESLVPARLSGFLSELSKILDLTVDTNTVYSASASQLKQAFSNPDPYETSRILNKELSAWPATPHLMETGSYALPPISNIALAIVDDLGESNIFEVPEWGVINATPLSQTLECTRDTCYLSVSGESLFVSTVVSALRKWLGLSPTDCLSGDDSCYSIGISVSEKIVLADRFRKSYIERIIENNLKQETVLSNLPSLVFNEQVSKMTLVSINQAVLSINSNSTETSTEAAKLGALLSDEALSHETIIAPSHFFLEFMFALYGPIGLPIAVPVIGIIIQEIRRRRKD